MTIREQLVADHSQAMLATLNLPKNQAKGDDWVHAAPLDLLSLLHQEVRELEAVVWRWYHGGESSRIQEEAADVSNFAAMIADRCKLPTPARPHHKDRCPDCGAYLQHASGCRHCTCGFTRCG